MKTQVSFAQAMRLLPTTRQRRDAEVMKRGSMIVEIYSPTGSDPQRPHNQDEIYIVARGKGTFINGKTRAPFKAGDVLFVPAGVEHRFEKFSKDFATWVVFYGALGGEKPAKSSIKKAEKGEPSRNTLIAHCQSAYVELNAFLDTLSESQATDLKDAAGWAIKDHVLHLGPWMNSMLYVMERKPKWDGLGVSEAEYAQGFDVVNTKIFQRDTQRSFYDARWQLQHKYREFIDMLMRARNEDVLRPYKYFARGDDRTEPVFGWLWGNCGAHFYEHLPWMKAIVAQTS